MCVPVLPVVDHLLQQINVAAGRRLGGAGHDVRRPPAEPQGRPLVVVTSDQEVARDVEATGAWVVPSSTLVARIQHL